MGKNEFTLFLLPRFMIGYDALVAIIHVFHLHELDSCMDGLLKFTCKFNKNP